MRILIIEDAKRLAKTLADIIQELGYTADLAYDGEEGLDFAESNIYDAIVLDVMLPKLDGYKVLKQLRCNGIQTPVLMLTAKAELEDRIHGLNLGADYYLTKPFDNKEFIACLKTVLRRQIPYISETLAFGDLELTPSLSTLHCGDKSLQLNSKELEIMRLLILNTKNIISKDLLINKIWGYDSDATYNNVEAYISFLRKKLLFLNSNVVIVIIRKAGYHLEMKHDS